MWFNIKDIKLVFAFYKKLLYWRSFLFIPKFNRIWSLNKTYFRKSYIFKFRFTSKLRYFIQDFSNYLSYREIKIQELRPIDKYLNPMINMVFFNVLFFHLNSQSINFLLFKKYNMLWKKNNLLQKKYMYLLKTKNLYMGDKKNFLSNLFLLYKYFFLSESLLLYFDFYQFKIETFCFSFTKLGYFLKYFFLRKCSLQLKIKIYEDAQFVVDYIRVFFAQKARWLDNLDIFEEDNQLFFDQIPLDKIFMIWNTYKCKYGDSRDVNFQYLYWKYKVLDDKLKYLKVKLKYLKKKKNFMDYFLLMFQYENLYLNLKNKKILSNLSKMVPFLNNRNQFLNLIFLRRKRFRLLKKIPKYKNQKLKINVLRVEKKEILYIFFFILFINYYKKLYIKPGIPLFIYSELQRRFLKIKFLKKKRFFNFKLIFMLYYNLSQKFKCKNWTKNFQIFLFSFFFFYLKKKFIEKKIIINDFNSKDLDKNNIFKKYNIKELNEHLLLFFFKVLFWNFTFEVDNVWTMRYDLLYHSLLYKHTKYWFIIKSRFLKNFKKIENFLIKKISNLQFFLLNLFYIKKLYSMYILFSFDVFMLDEYPVLMNSILKIFAIFLKKKIKQKKPIKENIINKKEVKLLIFNFLVMLKKRIKNAIKSLKNFQKKQRVNLILNLKFKNMYFLCSLLKKDVLRVLFKLIYLSSLKEKKNISYFFNKKIPLILKLYFNRVSSCNYYLLTAITKEKTKYFKIITYLIYYIFLLQKVKKKYFKIKKFKIKKKFKYVQKNFIYTLFEREPVSTEDQAYMKTRTLLWTYKLYRNYTDRAFRKDADFENDWNTEIFFDEDQQDFFFYLNYDKIKIILKKNLVLVYLLYFFLQLRLYIYQYCLFILNSDFLNIMLFFTNTTFLINTGNFDLRNDLLIAQEDFTFTLNKIKINFFWTNNIYYFKTWWLLKNKLYMEYLNITINLRIIIIAWFDFLNNLNLKEPFWTEWNLDSVLFVYFVNTHFYLKYSYTLWDFMYEIGCVMTVFFSYWSYYNLQIKVLLDINVQEVKFINLELIKTVDYIMLYNIYLKNFFLKLKIFGLLKYISKWMQNYVALFSPQNRATILDINKGEYYFNVFFRKKQNFKLKFQYLLFQKKYYCCDKCSTFVLTYTSTMIKKIKFYQKFLKFDDERIFKVDFIFCNSCGKFRLSLNEKTCVLYFDTIKAVLKYFIINDKVEDYVYIEENLFHCRLQKYTNYIYFEELRFGNLIFQKYSLNFLFFFSKRYDIEFENRKVVYGTKGYTQDLYIKSIVATHNLLCELEYWYVPQIVLLYEVVLGIREQSDYVHNERQRWKQWRKEHRVGKRLYRRIKKEIKLVNLNLFFEDIRKRRKQTANLIAYLMV